MKNIKITLLTTVVSFSLPIFATKKSSLTQSFKKGSVKELNLNNTSGEVIVETTSEESTVNLEKLEWTNEDCSLKIQENKGVLTIDVKKHSSWKSWFRSFISGSAKCLTKIKVKVPEQTDIDLANGAGNVSIEGVHGTYDVKLGSGNLSIDDAKGSSLQAKVGSGSFKALGDFSVVDIKTGAGKIHFENGIAPLGETSITTGTGDIYYKNKAALKSGLTEIKTGTGDIKISLPKDSELSVSFKSGVGKLQSDFVNTKGRHKVSAKSGVGSLTVEKN